MRIPLFLVIVSSTVLGAVPDFNRDVRPILSRSCFKCHGPDEKTRKGELRLDLREESLKAGESGAVAIVPGKPEDSEVIARIFSKDRDEMMPPRSAKMNLPESDKETLKRWIEAGAPYDAHWAFLKPERPEVPVVHGGRNSKNPIDAFIDAKLADAGIEPAQAAPIEMVARRLSYDLTGLPPTPGELEAFEKEAAGNRESAIEAYIDRLIASPQYGERWARRWLDLARYADSNGYEKDRQRNIWPYRDWVVRALNADMPFDRFTVEQLAGDMLPNPTPDQLIATGFHRNTMLNEEGGIDPLEFRYHAVADRVATTGATWLGLTLGCAQCHTHKYDPITHQEYFQIFAFLNNADEPDYAIPDANQSQRKREREVRAEKLLKTLVDQWPVDDGVIEWMDAGRPKVATASGASAMELDDGSILFAAPGPERETVSFMFEIQDGSFDRIQLDAMPDRSLPKKAVGRAGNGNFVLSEVRVFVAPRFAPEQRLPVRIARAEAKVEQAGFPVSAAIDGNESTGWAVEVAGQPISSMKTACFVLEEPVTISGGAIVTVELVQHYGTHHTMGRPRVRLGSEAKQVLGEKERRAAEVERRFVEWLKTARAVNVNWQRLRPAAMKSNLPFLALERDDSIFVSGDTTKADTYELTYERPPGGITALRLEALPDSRLPGHGPGMTYYEGPKGDFFLGELEIKADSMPVRIARATESYGRNTIGAGAVSAAAAVDGDPQTGWSCGDRPGERHEAVFAFEHPIDAARLDVTMKFGRHYASSLGRFRISVTRDGSHAEALDLPEDLAQLLEKPDGELGEGERQRLRSHFLLTAPELTNEAGKIRDLLKPEAGSTTLVMRERSPENPRVTTIHLRGEFTEPGEPVEPGVPSVLNPLDGDGRRDRLAFARWLVSPENPLTARVTVNRAWAAFFGTGLVKTTEDFGYQGAMPSHPELLDWLAVEFVEKGWSMKHLHRLIVSSATYQQSSVVLAEAVERDPDNRLLSRFPRHRLEAEMIRDGALRAADLLSLKAGGPPVKPPQADGVSEVAYGNPKWEASPGEDRHRRSLYTFVKRTAPFALYQTFDAPTGEACIPKRDVSNTALQALTLLNDVTFMEAARAMGRRLASEPGDDESKIEAACLRVLSRRPRATEVAPLREYIEVQRARLSRGELSSVSIAGADADAETAVWALVARALLNLDETVTHN